MSARDGLWRCGPEIQRSRRIVFNSVSYAPLLYGGRRRSLRESSHSLHLSSLFCFEGREESCDLTAWDKWIWNYQVSGSGSVRLLCAQCRGGWESLSSGMLLSFTWIINLCFSNRLLTFVGCFKSIAVLFYAMVRVRVL